MEAASAIAASSILCASANEFWEKSKPWRGQKVALVPTMGALHEGHLSLVRLARQHAERVVVSIFVNPLQFGPSEDFSRYPRTLEADLAACEAEGVDAVFVPDVREIYPEGMDKTTCIVPPAALTDILCGLGRPGHFTGVATVVYKLFALLRPDVAVFGEKDYQQLAILRRMAADLLLPTEIIPHPIVREADGLAMSSRNQYLKTPEDRQLALILPKTLNEIRQRVKSNAPELSQDFLSEVFLSQLATFSPQQQARCRLEYLEARFSRTLIALSGGPYGDGPQGAGEGMKDEKPWHGDKIMLFIAVKIVLSDDTALRLIDNIKLE